MATLIFTNNTNLGNAGIDGDKRRALGLDILDQEAALGFDKSLSKFEQLKQDHELVVVLDAITEERLRGLPHLASLIAGSEDLIMLVHNKPDESIIAAIRSLKKNATNPPKINKSHHLKNGLYVQVFNILLSTKESDKVERVRQLLDINLALEAKLELLHKCLKPEGARKLLTEKLQKEELETEKLKFWTNKVPNNQGKAVADTIHDLASGTNPTSGYSDYFGEIYMQTLSALAEALLPASGEPKQS